MKMLLFLILFLQSAFLLAQSKNDSNKIIWSPTYKLKWEDFQSTPDTSDTFAAISFSTINCIYSHKDKKYYANAVFFRKLSWSKEKFRNSNILNHEQKHFDITEIYARRLLLALNNVNTTRTYRHIYDSVTAEMRAMQKQYDLETDCSRKYRQQKIWNERIRNTLHEWRLSQKSENGSYKKINNAHSPTGAGVSEALPCLIQIDRFITGRNHLKMQPQVGHIL